jgi:hypothetical protein
VKKWAIPLALLFAVAVYLIAFRVTPAPDSAKVSISPANPFFSPRKIDMPFDVDPLDHGEKLVRDQKNADAVAVLGGVFKGSGPPAKKSSAMLTAGIALTAEGTTASSDFAREVFEQFLVAFPTDKHADTAHYYLGAIAMDSGDPSTALTHFTTILADFPDSGFARNAAFHARTLANLIRNEVHTVKDRALRMLGPFIPRDAAAMTTLLAYMITALTFVAYDWKKIKDKLFEEKHPAAWAAIALTFALIGVNYVKEYQHTASVVDLPKVLLKK